MDNLVSVLALNISGNQIAPCVKVLRGIYIASQQRAQFVARMVYQYTSGGEVVNTGTITIPLAAFSVHTQLDPLWLDVHGPAGYQLPAPVDAGTKISASIRLSITDLTTGALVDSSQVDTQEITPTIVNANPIGSVVLTGPG